MSRILVSLLVLGAMAASASMRIEPTAYQGWPDCYRVTNGTVELIVTSDVGPRILPY